MVHNCIYIYIFTYIYICDIEGSIEDIYTCVYVHGYIWYTNVYTYIYLHGTHMHIHLRIYIYIHMIQRAQQRIHLNTYATHMYTNIHGTHMYIHIYIYFYIYLWYRVFDRENCKRARWYWGGFGRMRFEDEGRRIVANTKPHLCQI